MRTERVTLDIDNKDYSLLTGVEEENLKRIEKACDVELYVKDTSIAIKGTDDAVEKAVRIINTIQRIIIKYSKFNKYDLELLVDAVNRNAEDKLLEALDTIIARTYTGKPIRAMTLGQKVFIDKVKANDLTFAVGPAGTGKTYLAVVYAVELLKKGQIKKIILTRPAVEAGENLGFLPGDLKEKVDPYLRPLYDALDDMLSSEKTLRYIENNTIEIAPLAYMRGRTLDDAMIILDEAQNTTKAQMIMFLTRLGRNSKMIVTGDLTQVDLHPKQESGLKTSIDRLQDIDNIAFVKLTNSDVVRHPLVIEILKRFENNGGM
ncbi:PhoH family protein [Erysipelothrix larvae]|uniref:PhoH family protein n=1 Tax=Erysipelothrix larvae TaxID=1514105 RepID=UPI000AEA6541|nr:PhoH family protein [Erysipelothrix larvae]